MGASGTCIVLGAYRVLLLSRTGASLLYCVQDKRDEGQLCCCQKQSMEGAHSSRHLPFFAPFHHYLFARCVVRRRSSSTRPWMILRAQRPLHLMPPPPNSPFLLTLQRTKSAIFPVLPNTHHPLHLNHLFACSFHSSQDGISLFFFSRPFFPPFLLVVSHLS